MELKSRQDRHPRCAFCHDALAEPVETCTGCQARYHRDCLRAELSGGCGTPGCSAGRLPAERRAARQTNEGHVETPFERRLRLGMALTASPVILAILVLTVNELGPPPLEAVAFFVGMAVLIGVPLLYGWLNEPKPPSKGDEPPPP